jgi:hypothetical protein
MCFSDIFQIYFLLIKKKIVFGVLMHILAVLWVSWKFTPFISKGSFKSLYVHLKDSYSKANRKGQYHEMLFRVSFLPEP